MLQHAENKNQLTKDSNLKCQKRTYCFSGKNLLSYKLKVYILIYRLDHTSACMAEWLNIHL